MGGVAELINEAEADLLSEKWSIPFKSAGDKTWIYDSEILKKVETT